MTGPAFRAGDLTELRPVEADDLEAVQRLFSEPESRRRRIDGTTPMSETAMESWHEEDRDDAEDVFLVTADGEPLGIAQLRRVDRADGSAILTWLFDPERSDDQAADALAEVVGWAFDEQRLDRLTAEAPNPDGAHGVLEAVGFVEEGCFRQSRYVDGEFVDVTVYGLLRSEWEG